jgi:hypothetical protein
VARPAKPWFRKDRDQWVVILHGKWHVLAKGKRNRNLAYRAFIDLTSKVEGTTTSRTLACDVCRILVEHARVNLKPNTYESYKRFLDPFAEYIGRVDGNEVEPRQVTHYCDQARMEVGSRGTPHHAEPAGRREEAQARAACDDP